MWAKPALIFASVVSTEAVYAHALGTDPTLIERLEAGATLPFELGVSWTLWLAFAIWVCQHLPRAGYLFSGLGLGGVLGALTWSFVLPPMPLIWALFLGLSLWMTAGRSTPSWVLSVGVAIAAYGAMVHLLSAHADLAEDGLISGMAALFLVATASFLGGVLKQTAEWVPVAAPIGLRVLASWLFAGVAIQWAMSTVA